jgi:hypothetical protein
VRRVLLLMVAISGLETGVAVAATPAASDGTSRLAALPVTFERNAGQAAPEVQYLSRGRRFGLALSARAASVSLPGGGRVKLEWLGASPEIAPLEGTEPTGGQSHYLTGEAESGWRTNVAHYSKVWYRSLYPGIDMVFYGNRSRPEFDFVLAPGADPEQIRIRVSGGKRISLDKGGELVITVPNGSVRLGKPSLYQEIANGQRQEVAGSYVRQGRNVVGFAVGSYDRSLPLVIDPTIATTYTGGLDVDIVSAVATDPSGNIYLTGYTLSGNFPKSASPYKNSLIPGDSDAFVMKLNPTATTVLYSTYLGGIFADYGRAIAVDAGGAAFITGSTIGRYPVTAGAFRPQPANAPAIFVTKLNAAGNELAYSTYLDGAGAGHGIAVDATGNAYIAGYTYSATFTTTVGAVQRDYGGATDAFVVKLDPTGASQVYSTFLGGSGEDQATTIRVTAGGSAYVAGFTSSANFPFTPGAYRTAYSGGTDAFVTQIDSLGSGLTYSTFLGGTNIDRAYALDVDSNGNAYVAGQTYSSGFLPSPGALQGSHGGGADAFLVKLSAGGSSVTYWTFLGSSGTCAVPDPFRTYQCDGAFAVAVESNGTAWIAGVAGAEFPLIAGHQTTIGGNGDAFVAQISADGASLLYGSFVGGGLGEAALSLATSPITGTVAVGFTNSTDLPVTPGALQPVRGGGAQEGFLTLLAPCSVTLAASSSFFPNTAGSNYSVAVTAPAGCAWVASTTDSWITVNSPSTLGSGSLQFAVAANAGCARAGTIHVNDKTYTVNQVQSSCVTLGYTFSYYPATSGTYSLPIFTQGAWFAITTVPWITLNPPTSGSGNGNLSYTLAANGTTQSRTGVIGVGNKTLTLIQSPPPAPLNCSYSLSTTAETVPREGISSSLLVMTQSGCDWTASSGAGWVAITGGFAGSGEGVVGYRVEPNTSGQSRSASLNIAGQTLTITQLQ